MNTTHTGGPAFPSHGSMGEVVHEGMHLRDYFAAQALTGFLHNTDRRSLVDIHEVTASAYKLADAMLEARK